MKTPADNTVRTRLRTSRGRFGALAALAVTFVLIGGAAHASALPGPVRGPAIPQVMSSASQIVSAYHASVVTSDRREPLPPRMRIAPETDPTNLSSGGTDLSDVVAAVTPPSDVALACAHVVTDASAQDYTLFASRASRTRGQPTTA